MEDEFLENYIKENYEVYDRFTFDKLFKTLLAEGYDHEEAKDIILYNCALSALVLQERIHNGYCLKMSAGDIIAPDLMEMYRQELKKAVLNEN